MRILRTFTISCLLVATGTQILCAQQFNGIPQQQQTATSPTEKANNSVNTANGIDMQNMSFSQIEDSLNILAKKMLRGMLPGEKMNAGLTFARLLYKTLQRPDAYQYGFDSLGKIIHILQPENKDFRIFNWLISPDQHIVRYYGIIQTPDSVYPLTNYSERMVESKTLLEDSLDGHHWFGAEYYKLFVRKASGQKYYFILGYNRDGSYSNKKILDVLYFTEHGPVFGAPLFQFPDRQGKLHTQYRILWQYEKGAACYLDYNADKKIITFDRLHSRINNPLKKNTFVPTGNVDGLKWEQGQWRFIKNIIKPMKLKDGQAPVNGVIQKATDK